MNEVPAEAGKLTVPFESICMYNITPSFRGYDLFSVLTHRSAAYHVIY